MSGHSLSSIFEAELSNLPLSAERYVVAYSGGLDSSVLLDLLVSLNNSSSEHSVPILAWHINHGLQRNASEMENFCKQRAAEYEIEYRSDSLELGTPGSNVEQICRDQRYKLFQNGLLKNDVLLMAHHADDQSETFLLNAFRGAGVTGLQGIPKTRALGEGMLFRPLLSISRRELSIFAVGTNLKWIDDPSNESLDFDRNFLRHNVVPEIKSRWPSINNSLSKCSTWQQEAQELLVDLAEQDYRLAKMESIWCDHVLSTSQLKLLSEPRQKNLLRYWLSHYVQKQLPAKKLATLVSLLKGTKSGQAVIESTDFELKFYDESLFSIAKPKPSKKMFMDLSSIDRKSVLEYCDIADKDQSLELKTRQDLNDSSYNHRLKRLFQTKKVPPWERDDVILVLTNQKIVNLLSPDFQGSQRDSSGTV